MITKVEKRSREVLISIGADIIGYSGSQVFHDPVTGSSVSFCGSNRYNENKRIIIVDIPSFMWRIDITEASIIGMIRKEPYEKWIDLATKAALSHLTPEQLFTLIQHTVNMVSERASESKVEEKLFEIRQVLGL